MKRIVLTLILTGACLWAHGQWKNLVFEGGGIRGIAYAGAIEALEKEHVTDSMEQLAGTSVGAVVACLLAVDYHAPEIRDILYDLKIQTFNDGKFIFVGGMNRLVKRFGWYRGNSLENWVGTLLEQKTGREDLTFRQLHELHLKDRRFKDLFVTATNLSQQRLTVFSWQTYPEMQIRTAVRASLSIPLYFSAVRLDKDGNKAGSDESGYEVFVDGGILANYPLTVFDEDGKVNRHTLGIKLERPEQLTNASPAIAPYEIVNFKTYVGALYNLVIETLNRDSNYAAESFRTVYISTENITPKVRRISRKQKELLYTSGVKGVELFFKKTR